MRTRLLLTLAALFTVLLHVPAHAIVNGDTADAEKYRAIVSLGNCTGTFIHGRFILTAAHCIRQCSNSRDTGCITGTPKQVLLGTAVGVDGPTTMVARDGLLPGEGNIYPIDHVYFARASDLNRSRPADVAILRTTVWFTGELIPAFPAQDLPAPDESYYCKRFEYTWPWVAGYSTNAGTVGAMRRIGRAFAECDLELDQTEFKLDGHGRDGQQGIRICKGDSGGPVIWESGYGGYVVGGVNSGMDNYMTPFTDTTCPSEKGEGYHAFIPAPLLDRVATTDGICQGESQWRRCPGVPVPYRGHNAEYLGTEIEQCKPENWLKVRGISTVSLNAGQIKDAFLNINWFEWDCGGDTDDSTTAPGGTEYLITKRALTDRQIIYDTYKINKPDADGQPQPASIDPLNDDNRPAVAMNANGVQHDMIEHIGGGYSRRFSPNSAVSWFIPSVPSSGEFPTDVSQIGSGVFVSSAATAVSSNGLRLHVVGRGTNNKFYHAMSEDGGSSWVVAWQALGEGEFKSAPAVATTGDGSTLHVYGIGTDNRIWAGTYVVGTDAASVTWEPMGEGMFIAAPAAAMSPDGLNRYVVGTGTDNRMWFTRLDPGAAMSAVTWTAIPAGTFTSGPAAVTNLDGMQIHVFGVGMDSRVWRAFSPDKGKSWRVAWLPIGTKVFASGPAATLSSNGNRLHVFGRAVPPTQFPDTFPAEQRVWRAFSGDGGSNWSVAWNEVVPLMQ
jgi:hypothetical protein